MTEFEKYLHENFNISPADCKQMAAAFKAETIRKGDFFLRSGSYCNRLSFIEQGILRIYLSQNNREVTQWMSTKNSLVSDFSSFFYRSPSIRDIQAVTDTQLLTIDHKQYMHLRKTVPAWNEFERVYVGKCFLFMESRIVDFISLTSEERYDSLFSQLPELFNQVPLQYIASMLGMTPETFSRIRKKRASAIS